MPWGQSAGNRGGFLFEVEQYRGFRAHRPSPQAETPGLLTRCDPDARFVQACQNVLAPSKPQQLFIKCPQLAVLPSVPKPPVETSFQKRFLRRRIGQLALPCKTRELFAPSLAHRIRKDRIAMAHEVREWRRFAIFLAHKEKRNER